MHVRSLTAVLALVLLCYGSAGFARSTGRTTVFDPSPRVYSLLKSSGKARTFSRVRHVGGIAGVDFAPIVVDDLVVVLNDRGKLVALNVEDPTKTVWGVELAEDESGVVYSGSLAYSNGVLLCAVGNLLYGLDPKDGRVKWKKVLRNFLSGDLVVMSDGKSVAALVIDNCLYVFGVADGGLLWHHEEVGSDVRIKGSLSVAYSPARDVVVMLLPDGKVLCLDVQSGDKVWEAALERKSLGMVGYSVVTPVISGKEVFLVSDSGMLESLELSSGKKLWSAEEEVASVYGPEGFGVFVVTRDRRLLAFDAQSKVQLWQVSLKEAAAGETVWNVPQLAAGKLWLLGRRGFLLGINPFSGALEESLRVSGRFSHSFSVSEGVVYAPAGKRGLILLS
ncbi:MAG: outer membrane protein assembly factor BamB family protein [Anaplasma sp.]